MNYVKSNEEHIPEEYYIHIPLTPPGRVHLKTEQFASLADYQEGMNITKGENMSYIKLGLSAFILACCMLIDYSSMVNSNYLVVYAVMVYASFNCGITIGECFYKIFHKNDEGI